MKTERQKTIYDVSEKAGVSIATVSRVLNGSPKVSSKTKDKVLRVMCEFGYEPNAFARGLGKGTMKTIGILCADVADIYLANAVSFLERELRQNGFDTILNCTGYDYETKVQGMKNMEARRVDSVILVGSHYIENNQKKNQYILDVSKNIPVMMVNGYLKGENIYCNLSDDYTAFENATEHLLSSGCREILFLYRENTHSQKLKLAGYAATLNKYKIPFKEERVLRISGRMEQIKNNLMEAYRQGLHCDSILACDDELAIGALKFTKAAGIKVPEEISIIGCNNSVLSICCNPELTSIDNKCELLCVNTVAFLMKVLEHLEVSKKTVLSTEYIERGTTRSVP